MNEVLAFWFETLSPSDWYRKSDELDTRIREQFEPTYRRVMAGETWQWGDTPRGRLAQILVLDQFGRNMFRGNAAAFAGDPVALVLAQEAVRCGDDRQLDDVERAFLYMPFMHSESAAVHEQAMQLFADLPKSLDYEIRHKAIIDRFGRYPHRNAVLGRLSTPEELAWMGENPGF
jgi:uncharacterized protein (DUF924 family)